MPLYTKPHTYANGAVISHTQVNANEDQLYTAINGGLDEDNLAGGTQIPNSYLEDLDLTKVLTYAADGSEYAQSASPIDSDSPSLPGTLQDELWRLRYRIGANRRYYLSTQYMDSSAVAQTASWIEPPIVGPQLIPNNGFEVHPLGTPNAPTSWTLYGTPSTVAVENPVNPLIGVEKRSLNIVTDASTEGLTITIPGLKESTKYLIGMAYNLTSGTLNLTTTGSLASGAYQHLNLTDSSASASAATIETKQGIVKTTAAAADITIRIFGTLTGADFNLIQVWMYELSDARPFELPHLPMQTASDNTASTGMTGWTGSGAAWRTDTLSTLSLTQYIPYRGYRLIYEVSVPIRADDSSQESVLAYGAIQLNIDGGGASTVTGPELYEGHAVSSNGTWGHTFTMRHVVENPTPGSSYAFTFLLGARDNSDYSDIIVAPLVNGVQMVASSRLIVERI